IFQLKNDLQLLPNDKKLCQEGIQEIVNGIFAFIGLERLFRLYPKYANGTYFKQTTKEVVEKLTIAYMRHLDWNSSISDFLGLFSIPVMTVHKSKGLEYDTVIFL